MDRRRRGVPETNLRVGRDVGSDAESMNRNVLLRLQLSIAPSQLSNVRQEEIRRSPRHTHRKRADIVRLRRNGGTLINSSGQSMDNIFALQGWERTQSTFNATATSETRATLTFGSGALAIHRDEEQPENEEEQEERKKKKYMSHGGEHLR